MLLPLKNNKLTNYLKESYKELKKVIWPSKKETWRYTLLVIGISLVVASFLGAMDYFLNWGLNLIIK